MPPATFAGRLAATPAAERAALLAEHGGDPHALAHELRQLYFASYSSDPQLAAQAAAALADLAARGVEGVDGTAVLDDRDFGHEGLCQDGVR